MTEIRNPAAQSGKLSNGCVIAIIIVVVLGLVAVGLGFLAFKKGKEFMGEEAKVQVRDDPAVLEHIGEIQEISWSITGTAAAPENKNKQGDDQAVMVFDVTGSKGNGEIKLWMMKGAKKGHLFSKGTLRTTDGKVYDLTLKSATPTEETAPEKESMPEKKSMPPKGG